MLAQQPKQAMGQAPSRQAASPSPKSQSLQVAQEGLSWLNGEAVTLMLPCKECSRSLPEGSSVKRAKPERAGFLMPVSWFSRWRNSSTVEEPSKLTTCRGEALVSEGTLREELTRASGQVLSLRDGKAWLKGTGADAKGKGSSLLCPRAEGER